MILKMVLKVIILEGLGEILLEVLDKFLLKLVNSKKNDKTLEKLGETGCLMSKNIKKIKQKITLL